jgi:hypothetical protein
LVNGELDIPLTYVIGKEWRRGHRAADISAVTIVWFVRGFSRSNNLRKRSCNAILIRRVALTGGVLNAICAVRIFGTPIVEETKDNPICFPQSSSLAVLIFRIFRNVGTT